MMLSTDKINFDFKCTADDCFSYSPDFCTGSSG